TELFPGEGLLEDPLAEIAGEEARVRTMATECRQKAELGDADVLCFVDDHMIECRPRERRGLCREPMEHRCLGDEVALAHRGTRALEDRPEDLALLLGETRLAPEAADVAVGLPGIELPGVDDGRPFAPEEVRGEFVRPRLPRRLTEN